MSLDNFNLKVKNINNNAGNFPRNPSDEGYWKALKRQAEITQLELNEVFAAIEEKNLEKLRDAVGDVAVTDFGLAHIGSLPLDEDANEIADCLLTRFCKDGEHAELTQKEYAEISVKTKVRYSEESGVYVVLSAEDQTGDNGEFYPEGKFLKASGFKQPTFKPLD